MRDALYQSEIGNDGEAENEYGYTPTAPIKCGGFLCSDKYVTRLCQGTPEFALMNHNHCTECGIVFALA